MIDFNVRDYMKMSLPAGKYTFVIRDAEIKPTKAGNASLLKIKLEVVSEFKKGFVIFDNLNIYNSNETAQRIAREKLAELCVALDLLELKDTASLVDRVVDAEVEIEFFNNKDIPRVVSYKEVFSATGLEKYNKTEPAKLYKSDVSDDLSSYENINF